MSASGAPTCYGFAVHSAVPLRFTRAGGGQERLRVEVAHAPRSKPAGEPIFAFTVNHPRDVSASLYGGSDTYEFHVSDVGTYRIVVPDRLIELPECDDEVRREQLLWNVPAMLCFVGRGDLCLHAAAVEVDGEALLLAGPGGSGKTTLTIGFHRAGHRILTEDGACIRLGERLAVLPGPALVRARVSAETDAPAGMRLAARNPGRDEYELEPGRRGSGEAVPIRGIVFLREFDGRPRLERRSPTAVIPDLWALALYPPTNEGRARCFEQVAAVASGLPCWNLHRPLRLDAMAATIALLQDGTAAS